MSTYYARQQLACLIYSSIHLYRDYHNNNNQYFIYKIYWVFFMFNCVDIHTSLSLIGWIGLQFPDIGSKHPFPEQRWSVRKAEIFKKSRLLSCENRHQKTELKTLKNLPICQWNNLCQLRVDTARVGQMSKETGLQYPLPLHSNIFWIYDNKIQKMNKITNYMYIYN
mgnify:CR=1 FL=1